jgi:anti-sigma regulatory factor (Ser/Thr protein kinase)
VGGDWYDMFVLPTRWVCISVGDVVGRGLHAAVIMSRLRSALRSYAIVSRPDPAAVLAQVDDKLQHFEPGEMATAVVAMIEPTLERMHVSIAGHPAPVVASGAERGTYLDLPVDPPLGVSAGRRRRSTPIELPRGAVTAFYTDGLVERRGVFLPARIQQLCDTVTTDPPEDLCIRIMASLVGHERPPDDVAVLVIRRAGSVTAAPIELTLPAVAASLGDLRAALRRWLTEAGATQTDVLHLVLASGEAASNVVEHAYGPEGGDLLVRAELDGDVAVVSVRDRGAWRAPRGTDRGRGRGLMAAATDDVTVERGPDGTVVVLRRRLGKEEAR